jgi:hypothetical protein
MTKTLLKSIILVSFLLLFTAFPLLAAPTQQQIDQAIQKGLEWLASKQADDGHFTNEDSDEYPLADTATAVLAFEDQGHFPDGNTQYSSIVEKGLDFIFQYAYIEDITSQPLGNPDSNGNGKGVYFDDGHWAYETGICLMSIIASEKPDRVVSTGPCTGWKYKDVVQDAIDYFAFAQGDADGGWRYVPNEEISDNSVTQWPVFAMLMAENWDIVVPNWVKTELNRWVNYIQDPTSGASGYTSLEDDPNMAKTGGLLVEMYWLGDNSNTSRAQKAIGFLNNPDEWEFQKGDAYAMFSIYKGLKLMGAKELSALPIKDWWNDYTQWIVDNQNQDGSWGDEGSAYDKFLSTGWYIVILEGQTFIQTGIDLTIQASPTTLPADGKSTSTITVTVKDLRGNLLSEQNVSLSVTKGTGTLPKTPKDNSNGTYTATYTASATVGKETITATVSNVSKTVDITLTAIGGGTARTLVIGESIGMPGKDVTVPIGMNNVDGVAGANITVLYDEKVLTIKEVKTTALTTTASLQTNTNTPGEILIAIAGAKALSGGSGTLIDMVFTINDSAKSGTETPISFKEADVFDATPKGIDVVKKNGKVTIGSACLKGDLNDDKIIDVKDAIILLQILADLKKPEDERQKCAADANGDNNTNASDALFILKKAVGLIPGAPGKEFSDGQVTIALENVYGSEGKGVTVPIKIDKFSAVGSGEFCITYNSSVLRAVKVTHDNDVLLASNIAQPGVVKIAFASGEGLNSDKIASISFDVLTDDVSALSFKDVELYSTDMTIMKSITIDRKFISPLARPQYNALLQNFPNPFNPDTWIPFQLKEASEVTVHVYNSSGELVRQLELGYKPAGLYVSQDRAVHWDGKDKFGMPVTSGIYFYSIQAGDFSAVKKLIVLR